MTALRFSSNGRQEGENREIVHEKTKRDNTMNEKHSTFAKQTQKQKIEKDSSQIK